jgi:type I restriction enzyme S subunit
MTGAAGQQRVPLEFVRNFCIPLPPLVEQDQMMLTLRTATQEQDIAVERVQQEIKLIREYRDRLIADVVTGQVDVRSWVPDPDDEVAGDALANDDEPNTDEEFVDGDD